MLDKKAECKVVEEEIMRFGVFNYCRGDAQWRELAYFIAEQGSVNLNNCHFLENSQMNKKTVTTIAKGNVPTLVGLILFSLLAGVSGGF